MRAYTQTLILGGLLCTTTLAFAGAAPVRETTLGEQQQVAITVYNHGQGLVRDVRTVTLPVGPVTLQWRDVASNILTQSVSLIDETDPEGVHILEQNYQYDLIDRNKLISKYLGKSVQIQLYDYLTEKTVIKTGTLLAPDVIEIGGKIYPGIPGQLILPELPGGLISVPTLSWSLESASSNPQTLAMSYLTSGMSWQADYVAVVNESDTALDLNGWTTIHNNSGTTYHDATLKLIAGDVHQVQPPLIQFNQTGAEGLIFGVLPKSQRFEEKSFFEYHLYTLGRPATLLNNEQKQIALLDAAAVPASKRFILQPRGDYLDYGLNATQKIDVQVKMEFENSKEHNLGMPLPKGTVRVYKADSDGSLQFIGEDAIDHTPKDETLRLFLGNAFDIAAERIVAERRKITDRIWEYDITVKLRNHKDNPVTVTVVDQVRWGDWTVVKHQGGDYTKRDASTLEFAVRAAPDVEQLLTYTIRREY